MHSTRTFDQVFMSQRKVSPETIGAPPQAVTAATRTLLQPLVRLMLDNGIGLSALVEILKEVYVNIAERNFSENGRPQNDSRVSIMTGVHRKDVRRLRRGTELQPDAPPSVLLGGQLVAQWTGNPDFLDTRGKPLKLPRLRRDGGARSFEALAESLSRDVGPRAMLDELLRLDIVHIDAKDRVCLNVLAFVPRTGIDEKAYYLAKNVHDHLAAAVHNLRGDAPPFLERSVHYTRLSPDSVAELTQMVETLAMKDLQKVNRRAISLKQRDRAGKPKNLRINFGVSSIASRLTTTAAPKPRAPRQPRENSARNNRPDAYRLTSLCTTRPTASGYATRLESPTRRQSANRLRPQTN
jgi:hypothetical protein